MDFKIMSIKVKLQVVEYYFTESLSQLRIGTYPTILFGQLAEHTHKKTSKIPVGSHLITCMNAICLDFLLSSKARQHFFETSSTFEATNLHTNI